VEEGSVIITVN